MMHQSHNASEYSNESREQVIRAMKVKQESSASKPNANTENCYRGSSTQLCFPAFPRRITNYFHYHKDPTKYTGVPNSTISSTINLWVVKRPQTFSFKILFPYKVLREQWVRFEALVCKGKRKRNQRILENTSENEREFQHKNQESKLFWMP